MQTKHSHIRKMSVSVDDKQQAQYYLTCGDDRVHLNPFIGQHIHLSFSDEINCVHCGRKTKKTFNQGYCFPCFRSLAQCDSCIVKPEKCHYEQGTCREPAWGEANCLQDHFVYLANTGAIKVGITRHVTEDLSVSSRWIDQGATQAMPIFRVHNRKISGLVETCIAQHISDKTNWRTMLKGDYPEIDLLEHWQALETQLESELHQIQQTYGLQAVNRVNAAPVTISYPVLNYPTKIKSLNFDKQPQISGQLLGIKGQYLLLDEDRVLNLRNASGYHIDITVS